MGQHIWAQTWCDRVELVADSPNAVSPVLYQQEEDSVGRKDDGQHEAGTSVELLPVPCSSQSPQTSSDILEAREPPSMAHARVFCQRRLLEALLKMKRRRLHACMSRLAISACAFGS